MDRAASELFLACLHVETTPERDEVLKNAFPAVRDWEGLVAALEGHGLLALFASHQERLGFELPPNLATTLLARRAANLIMATSTACDGRLRTHDVFSRV